MANYVSEFEKMNREYQKLYQAYYDFKAKTDNKHREKLLNQLKVFGKQKSFFRTSVRNLYLGKEDK